MQESRRHLLRSFVAFISFLSAAPILRSQGGRRPTQTIPPTNPANPNLPLDTNSPVPSAPDPKAVEKQHQLQIRADVDKMYSLINELRQELRTTNTTSILDVSFIQKAEQIAKLAKQVKNLAKS